MFWTSASRIIAKWNLFLSKAYELQTKTAYVFWGRSRSKLVMNTIIIISIIIIIISIFPFDNYVCLPIISVIETRRKSAICLIHGTSSQPKKRSTKQYSPLPLAASRAQQAIVPVRSALSPSRPIFSTPVFVCWDVYCIQIMNNTSPR